MALAQSGFQLHHWIGVVSQRLSDRVTCAVRRHRYASSTARHHRDRRRGSVAAVVQVDPNEVRAAASRSQMIGADLGAGGAPPVSLATTWPSAAATGRYPWPGGRRHGSVPGAHRRHRRSVAGCRRHVSDPGHEGGSRRDQRRAQLCLEHDWHVLRLDGKCQRRHQHARTTHHDGSVDLNQPRQQPDRNT